MRKHQPIWLRLKLEKQAQVAAPLAMHARIIKAVIKEKWSDVSWKKVLKERGETSRISYTVRDNLISFTLTIEQRILLKDIL